MSILDTVEPDLWVNSNSFATQQTVLGAKWETRGSEAFYSHPKVESLLAEHRKQVLLEAAYWFSANICSCPAAELRRMASELEGDK